MAAHTSFSPDQLRSIIRGYAIGSFVSAKPFSAGYVQTNIRITTTQGRFVLRLYENRTENSVMFEADLLDHLVANGYPCARPIVREDGGVIGSFAGKPFILFSYVPGRHSKNLTDEQLEALVTHLAQLHTITEGYRPANHALREPRTKAFCLQAARIEAARFDDEEGARRLALITKHLGRVRLPRDLPRGVIHGDFDAANLKYSGDTLTGVLDFDDATYTHLIYDLGVVLLYWTRFYTDAFDLHRARRIVNIYERYRPLTRTERDHLYDAIKMHALMLMSWLMYDSWKGKDLFVILAGILEELDAMGRERFTRAVTG